MDADDQIRIARNESRRRDVNEAIEAGRQERSGLVGFVCECGQLGCTAILEVSIDDYETVRENPRRFLVCDGHEQPAVETVVERHDRYLVVEKRGEAGRVAAAQEDRR
jgi:hypothetical protein